MAALFDIVSSHRSEELQGGSRLIPVLSVGFVTKPTGVYAEARVAGVGLQIPDLAGLVTVYAENIEQIASYSQVVGLAYIQDVNAAGQLVDLLEITVQSTNGQGTDSFTASLNFLETAQIVPKIQHAVADLDALFAL